MNLSDPDSIKYTMAGDFIQYIEKRMKPHQKLIWGTSDE
jgi:hypothetical protein